MRKAVVPIRKCLGYANTGGLCELIQTDWEESQWSSQGEEDPDLREQLRTAAGVPSGNLEVRPREWHARQVRRVAMCMSDLPHLSSTVAAHLCSATKRCWCVTGHPRGEPCITSLDASR